jgi:tol-pal system protein YbgF
MNRASGRRTARRLGRLVVLVGVVAIASGCAGRERSAEVAALRSQIEELRKSQETNARDLARLAGEVKALDAQSAFLVGEAKTTSEELPRLKTAIEANGKLIAALRSPTVKPGQSEPPGPTTGPTQARTSPGPDMSPPALYASAMTSVQADEYPRALAEFSELTKRFPESPLAASAQYWVGEVYYRQREFERALGEFQRVVDGYPKSPQIPDALLKIGLCYRAQNDEARARDVWTRLSKEYPGTSPADQAGSLLGAPAGRPAR